MGKYIITNIKKYIFLSNKKMFTRELARGKQNGKTYSKC